MTFAEYGFLGAPLPPLPIHLELELSKFCDLVEKANRISHELYGAASFQVGEPFKGIAYCAYVRLLHSLQASYILVRFGLNQDAGSCLRTSFEALVLLRACRVAPDLAKAFLASDEHEQLKLVNANISRLDKEEPDSPLLGELRCRKIVLGKSIVESGGKKVSTYELAEAVGLGALYDSMWRIVSKYAHVTQRALEEFVVFRSGTVVGKYAPEYREASTHLIAIVEFSLQAHEDVRQLFSLVSKVEGIDLAEELRKAVNANEIKA